MPQITPITPEGTITIQAKTQLPSEALKQRQATQAIPPATPVPKEETQTQATPKPPQDERLLKARLVQERFRRQLEDDKKKLAAERQQLEIEKANSRRWQEAATLAQSGRHLEAAEKAGITYDQLTQQILNGGQIPPARVAQEAANEIIEKRFKAFEEQQKQQSETQQKQQYTQALKQIASEVKHLVDNSDKFPLVKESGSYQDIVNLIESEFHRTGRIVPIEEALQRWETEALEGLEELYKLEPVRTKVSKEPPKPKEEQVPQTLTQRSTAPIPQPKALTEAERRQRAIDAFHNRLS